MSDFEDIRPFHDSEVKAALDRLVHDSELTGFVAGWLYPRLYKIFPGLLSRLVSLFLKREVRGVEDIAGFQDMIARYAKKLVREGTTDFVYEGFDRLDPDKAYLFVSNHRDIAGDSMLLDYALYLNGLQTVRIAIGDNLVQREFATSLMKLNKGFFIKRSVEGPRKMYAALLQSSEYIRHSLDEGQSIWIAQSEGRSKDGLDVTDPAIIKMFVLSQRKRPLSESIEDLNILPLSISYEFDPCDVMKAKELGTIAREGTYKKPPGEDLKSLVMGLSGKKGRVILRLGTPLAGAFESPDAVAAEIDHQIMRHMTLFPVNYWALSKVDEPEYREAYEALSDKSLAQVDRKEELRLLERLKTCPPAHRPYWLKMYANPVLNVARVLNQKP
jgi:1-acyl-sn-glycerol-3-phosphate acyltransferase